MSSLHPESQRVIPNRIKYRTPTISDYVSRQTTKILPNNAGDYKQNSQIVIEIPAGPGMADFQNSYLSMDIQLTNSVAANKIVLDSTSCSFIKRLTIRDGYGNTLEDMVQYNELVGIIENLTASTSFSSGVGQILDGTPSSGNWAVEGTKRELAAQNGSRRCLKLVSGILQSTQLFPIFATKGLQIIIDVCTDFEAGGGTVADAAAPGVTELTISNVAFVLDTVQVSSEYRAGFNTAMNSNGISFWCPTYLTTIHSTSGTNFTTTLSENVKSLKHVWFFFRDTAKNNVVTERQTEIHQGKNLSSYIFRHGVRYNPQQKVNCKGSRAEAMSELLKSINILGDVTTDLPFNLENYSDDATFGANGASTKAIFGQGFEVDAAEHMSGIDSNKQPLSIELEFPVSTPTNLYTFVAYDQVIVITNQGCLVSY